MACWCFRASDRFRFNRELATDFLAHLGVVAAICLENAVNRARLVRSGLTDFLTGFHNRRYLHARLCEELARAKRDHLPIACLMIDVDHFKRINDEYGHLAGDAVLREVAQRIDDEMRLSDTGARFGGDEFAIVLPHGSVTDGERVASRVLEAVRGSPIVVGNQRSEQITLSIGVAAARPDGKTKSGLQRAGRKADRRSRRRPLPRQERRPQPRSEVSLGTNRHRASSSHVRPSNHPPPAPPQQRNKHRRPHQRHNRPHRQLPRASHRPRQQIRRSQNRPSQHNRRRRHHPVIAGPKRQPNSMRRNQPNKPNRPRVNHRKGGQRGTSHKQNRPPNLNLQPHTPRP